MQLRNLALLLSVALLTASCNFSFLAGPGQLVLENAKPQVFEKVLSGTETPSFELIRSEILAKDRTCTQCHTWADSYEQTKFYVTPGNFRGSALISNLKNFGGTMPKDRSALSDTQIEVLKLWIESGANEQAIQKAPGEPGGSGNPDTTPAPIVYPENPDFKDLTKLVFATNCASCHNPNSSSGAKNYPFQNYKALMDMVTDDGRYLVTAGKPDDSALWHSVEEPYMPPKKAVAAGMASYLSENQKTLLKRWIEQGAVEN